MFVDKLAKTRFWETKNLRLWVQDCAYLVLPINNILCDGSFEFKKNVGNQSGKFKIPVRLEFLNEITGKKEFADKEIVYIVDE